MLYQTTLKFLIFIHQRDILVADKLWTAQVSVTELLYYLPGAVDLDDPWPCPCAPLHSNICYESLQPLSAIELKIGTVLRVLTYTATEVEVEWGQKLPGTTASVKLYCNLSQYTDLRRPIWSKIFGLISS